MRDFSRRGSSRDAKSFSIDVPAAPQRCERESGDPSREPVADLAVEWGEMPANPCPSSSHRTARRRADGWRRFRSELLLAAVGVVGALVATASRAQPAPLPGLLNARPGATLSAADDAFLDELQRASFRFFVEQGHPVTGLVRDRARADGTPSEGKASVAASGFALSSWAIAAHRGWVSQGEALERVRVMLRFLANEAPRQHGFYYHFMEMDSGARAWQCEVSSIDTALFLAGAIIAREYFQDPEVTELVNRIYREMDWGWFLNEGQTLAMGWTDEGGFSRFRWNGYSEHTTMSILGLGAPENALDREYWQAWQREPAGSYERYYFIQGPPLFIHQFAHAYVDFRDLRDAYADYHHNSVLATLAHLQFCVDQRAEFPSWSERMWGVTASDSASGYKAWGGPPRTTGYAALDGTIVPCAAAGSLAFAPYETLMVLRHLRTVYGDRIWKHYGFVDAFNPETGWVNRDVIGIDLGITILQAENARSGIVWGLFMQAPEVQRALDKAGFVSKSRQLTWAERAWFLRLAHRAWQSLADEPVNTDTAGLRLTALSAARVLGLLPGGEADQQARAWVETLPLPEGDVALAEFAAALVTLRQAVPRLASDATRRFEEIDWPAVTLGAVDIASASRLAAFFKVAVNPTDPSPWNQLARQSEPLGPVHVLTPVSVPDQLRPGLWLDEGAIVTGASAAQLAYARAVEAATDAAGGAPDVMTAALLISHLPKELIEILERHPPADDWIEQAPAADRAALVITVANLLVPNCVKDWFQRDPQVTAARGSIAEFGQAAFGQNTSILWRYELAGPVDRPPARRAVAKAAELPREQWDWVRVAGLEFKDSPGDVHPDDPELEIRFAFTWDNEALHFHAEAIDIPPGYERPAERREFVELWIDPDNDGLVERGPDDYYFLFRSDGQALDASHNRPVPATITRTAYGYNVEASIPWSTIDLTPASGLDFAVSVAIGTAGRYEWEPSLKLNWRFFERQDERYELGTVHLE